MQFNPSPFWNWYGYICSKAAAELGGLGAWNFSLNLLFLERQIFGQFSFILPWLTSAHLINYSIKMYGSNKNPSLNPFFVSRYPSVASMEFIQSRIFIMQGIFHFAVRALQFLCSSSSNLRKKRVSWIYYPFHFGARIPDKAKMYYHIVHGKEFDASVECIFSLS